MDGKDRPLLALLVGGNTYVIPAYQRNYDWKQEQCERLFDDLVSLSRSGRPGHFFGSVVSVESSGFYTERLIIDGQQRMTTVSLLMLAMLNLIRSGDLEDAGGVVEAGVRRCLMDSFNEKDLRLKLKPIKNDLAIYVALFTEPGKAPINSNLTLNYHYFYQRIRERKELSAKQLFDAIGKLIVIDVGLKQEDDPQLVFESLNSTGLALTEGDKIRNYVLMGLDIKEQDDFYERYWNLIEKATSFDVSGFVRDWMSVKIGVTPPIAKVYPKFKEYKEKSCPDTEALLKDMLAYAELYAILVGKKTGCAALDDCLVRLNRLETTVTRPFFLEVLRLHREGVLTWDEVADVFLSTETYLFRRMMCDLPTNCLNKIFLALHKEIVRFDGTTADYVRKFKYALLSRVERGRMPRDDEFLKKLEEREVYKMSAKNRAYVLERFECFGNLERLDVYKLLDEEKLSIEHIMPRHLTSDWVKSLGDDYEAIHEKWLHRLANLTLTAYNSSYGNSAFQQKVDMSNGFTQSGVWMNRWISERTEWGEAELEQRNAMLVERAKSIWPCLDCESYEPEKKSLDAVSLADDEDMSGRLIASYSLRGLEQPVTSWIEMFNEVVKTLHRENPSVLAKLALSNDPAEVELSQYFASKASDLRNAGEVEPGLYSEQNSNTAIKLMILRKLFGLYEIDTEELVFSLRDDTESRERIEPPRRELRRKYWAYALDVIRAAHVETGIFSKASPSGDNWIDGFFGEPGAHLCVKANYNNAQALVYMVTSRAKPMFDFLESHKGAIEEKLGRTLKWNRGNDLKHSRIWVELEDVSIEKESDWPSMAAFQAEWTKRFVDVVVPLVREFNGNYKS